MKSVTQASSPAGTRMYLKYGNRLEGVMWICITIAVVLSFVIGGSRALHYSATVAVIYGFFEVFWCLGVALMGVGFGMSLLASGKLVFNFKKMWEKIRAAKPNFAVWIGHYMNMVAGVMQGVSLLIAGMFFLPSYMSGGVVIAGAIDLGVALIRCIPTQVLLTRAAVAKKVHVTTARYEDVAPYADAQRESWDGAAAPEEVLFARVSRCGDCMYVARHSNSEPIGFVTTIRLLDYDFDDPPTWDAVTDSGWCRTHNPLGRIMYGVDMSKMPEIPGDNEVHDILLMHCMAVMIKENLRVALLGGRLPGYHRFADQMTAEVYLQERDKTTGRPLDGHVAMYTDIPGVQAIGVLPDYFRDPKSLNYGVLLRWDNPFCSDTNRHWWRVLTSNQLARNVLAWTIPRLAAAEMAYREWRSLRRRNRPSPL
jgi:hypothetical protein